MFSVLVYEVSGPIFAKMAIEKAGEIGGMDRRGTVLAANLQLFRSRKDQLWPGNRAEEDGEHGTQRRTLLGPFAAGGTNRKVQSSLSSCLAHMVLKRPDGPQAGGGETMAATGSNLSVEMQERMEAQLLAVPEGKVTTAASPIDNPDAAYLAATTKIDITDLPFASSHESITDGTLTVTFSEPVVKLGPVPEGWSTWSAPPFSEDPNPLY